MLGEKKSPKNRSGQLYKKEKMENWDPGLRIFILTDAFRCVCRALKIDVRLIVELRTILIRKTRY